MKEVWIVEEFDGMQADTDENNFKKLNKKIMKPSDPNPQTSDTKSTNKTKSNINHTLGLQPNAMKIHIFESFHTELNIVLNGPKSISLFRKSREIIMGFRS